MLDLLSPYSPNRVLFLCKQRVAENGKLTSSGLLNSAGMVAKALYHDGAASTRLVDVVDGNCIDREVAHYRPTHVILEAYWVTPAKLAELTKLHPRPWWTVRNHSKLPFLSGEGCALGWSFDYHRTAGARYRLSSNSHEAVANFHTLLVPCDFTPNIYHGPRRQAVDDDRPVSARGVLNVGCFGAIRLLKNTLLQAVAAIEVARSLGVSLRFHVNVGRQEMEGAPVLKNLRSVFAAPNSMHALVEHPWMPHEEFLAVLQTMDLVMQVSHTETFNIVAADAVYAGVPVVGSADLPWLPPELRADPNSAGEMAAVARRVLAMPRTTAQRWAHERIQADAARALEAWRAYLDATR